MQSLRKGLGVVLVWRRKPGGRCAVSGIIRESCGGVVIMAFLPVNIHQIPFKGTMAMAKVRGGIWPRIIHSWHCWFLRNIVMKEE